MNTLTPPLILPLATLEQFKRHLNLDDADERDDERLWASLLGATATITQRTGRSYQPIHATLTHDADPRRPNALHLIADALAIERIVDAFGTLSADDVRLTAEGIVYVRGARSFVWDGDGRGALAVTGIWGWHDQWAHAWRASGDALLTGISADDDALFISDSTAPDALHSAPRFQRGQLLAIGTDEAVEYLGVMAIDSEAHRLDVVRGIHGTSAHTHDAHALIRVYQPPHHIQQTCLRLASWLYRLSHGGVDDALPYDLQNDLAQWRRVRV